MADGENQSEIGGNAIRKIPSNMAGKEDQNEIGGNAPAKMPADPAADDDNKDGREDLEGQAPASVFPCIEDSPGLNCPLEMIPPVEGNCAPPEQERAKEAQVGIELRTKRYQ